ncbi:MAG: rhodanese-like domain-containing protein [Lewinella sp.]|nr:rhodanese-like domain-containing protein [Anaerolineae bacterium]MCB0639071.1 rhodanese-like domain-containing protein [Lewinella sp.]
MLNFLKQIFSSNPAPDLQLLISQGAKIIDVRTPGEFQRGHVKGSINIPLNEVQAKLKQIKKYKAPIITCCASGNRSGMAAQILNQAGVEAVNGGPWNRVDRAVNG